MLIDLFVRYVNEIYGIFLSQGGSRSVPNPTKISDIGFLKTEPNRPQN